MWCSSRIPDAHRPASRQAVEADHHQRQGHQGGQARPCAAAMGDMVLLRPRRPCGRRPLGSSWLTRSGGTRDLLAGPDHRARLTSSSWPTIATRRWTRAGGVLHSNGTRDGSGSTAMGRGTPWRPAWEFCQELPRSVHNLNEVCMRLNLVTGPCLWSSAAPFRSERSYRYRRRGRLLRLRAVEVLEIDNCDVDQPRPSRVSDRR